MFASAVVVLYEKLTTNVRVMCALPMSLKGTMQAKWPRPLRVRVIFM